MTRGTRPPTRRDRRGPPIGGPALHFCTWRSPRCLWRPLKQTGTRHTAAKSLSSLLHTMARVHTLLFLVTFRSRNLSVGVCAGELALKRYVRKDCMYVQMTSRGRRHLSRIYQLWPVCFWLSTLLICLVAPCFPPPLAMSLVYPACMCAGFALLRTKHRPLR